MMYIVAATLFLVIVLIILTFVFRPNQKNTLENLNPKFVELQGSLNKIESGLKDDFRINREESGKQAKDNREELASSFKDLKEELTKSLTSLAEKNEKALEKLTEGLEKKLSTLTEKNDKNAEQAREHLTKSIKDFQDGFDKNVKSLNDLQRDNFSRLEEKQNKLVETTEKKLETMRETVDEKLQKTLNERLGQSFETVGKQLKEVQEGLGEMKNLAQDVGGLKKVLSNVKMRGGIGEVQLAMLLEQLLAPDQYEANVKTKASSNDHVEFAIKLPGKDDQKSQVWLPIDAKFPKDVYEQLQEAYEEADLQKVEKAQKYFDTAIKKMAKDINQKYIDPPNTTDFAIMFLPFEGIYAEVVRKADLLSHLQRECKVIVTGPTTLAAILNSLQIGFKTLAIQKRSSEVWQVLGAVKTEFENFSGLLEKAQNNIQTGMNQLDQVRGVRTRAINRKLRSIDSLDQVEAQKILPEIANNEIIDDEND